MMRPLTQARLSKAHVAQGALIRGWHPPEEWGCWTAAETAELRLTLAEPCAGQLGLHMDVAPSPVGAAVALTVNGCALPAVAPRPGWNQWLLPLAATRGETTLLVRLDVAETACPAARNGGSDDRTLGIGVRAVEVSALPPDRAAVDAMLSLARLRMPQHALVSGWHPQEEWGCWTSGSRASMKLMFGRALEGVDRLELDLAPAPVQPAMTVAVNGCELPAVAASPGRHQWTLPPECVRAREELAVEVRLSDTFSPALTGTPRDRRTLGVGVKAIGFFRSAKQPPTSSRADPSTVGVGFWPMDALLPINAETGWRGIRASGWRAPEQAGVWSADDRAVLGFRFAAPLGRALVLLLDIAPSDHTCTLGLIVDGVALEPMRPIAGLNAWELTDQAGKTTLCVETRVSCDRSDGHRATLGLRAIALLPLFPPLSLPLGTPAAAT